MLIAKRRGVTPAGYVERHHITPRCMGGCDTHENIVALTAREHFIAHALLARIHGGKAWAATAMMRGKDEVSSRTYEIVKRAQARCLSERMTGVKFTKEHRENLSGPKSDAHKAALSKAAKDRGGVQHGAFAKAKIGHAHRGKSVSEDTRAKMSASAKAGHVKRKVKQDMSALARARWGRSALEKKMKNMEFLVILAKIAAVTHHCPTERLPSAT